MDEINISTLDLNLLRTFVVMMEEQNVSRASERLHISQSAASNALERVREQLQDKVLERDGRTMRPTRTALELWPKITSALNDIESALKAHGSPDVSLMNNRFSIGVDEYTMTIGGESLFSAIRDIAPSVTLDFKIADATQYQQQLVNRDVDLLIAPLWQQLDGVERETLYTEEFVGLMSTSHPLAKKKITVKRYTSYSHVLVSNRGVVQGNVDVGLRGVNAQRDIAITTPWLESAVGFIEDSDLFLNIGKQLADRIIQNKAVRQFELPIAVPGFDVCMMWHPRDTKDTHHTWLRERVIKHFRPHINDHIS